MYTSNADHCPPKGKKTIDIDYNSLQNLLVLLDPLEQFSV
jgi:hypothetical protein